MCLLVAKPAGVDLPDNLEDICANAYRNNPDGSGFAMPGQLWKDPMVKPKKFAHILRKMITKDVPAVIHWRYSTSGKVNKYNCHPFRLDDGTIFAHNGTCSSTYKPTPELSDTAVLSKSAKNFDELYARCKAIASSGNKFAMVYPGRDVTIVGDTYGTWVKDIWFSNTSWKSTYDRQGYASMWHSNWSQYDNTPSAALYPTNIGQSSALSMLTSNVELHQMLEDKVINLAYKYGMDAVEGIIEELGMYSPKLIQKAIDSTRTFIS